MNAWLIVRLESEAADDCINSCPDCMHLSMVQASKRSLSPAQVKETTRDIKFLHNEMFFAVAQKKYVYIYDKRGVEIHCLRVSSTFCGSLFITSCCTVLQRFLHLGSKCGRGSTDFKSHADCPPDKSDESHIVCEQQ